VAIVGPTSGANTQADQIAVEATVVDAGGGIGRVEWRVNSVTLGADSRGVGRVAGSGAATGAAGTLSLRESLPLRTGENIIDLRVYNKAGLIASEAAAVKVTRKGSAQLPRLFVLTAGIDSYDDDALKLAYSKADARALGAAVELHYLPTTTDELVRELQQSPTDLAKLVTRVDQRCRSVVAVPAKAITRWNKDDPESWARVREWLSTRGVRIIPT